jgi:hypothetical protein
VLFLLAANAALLAATGIEPEPTPAFRLQTTPVAGDAELLTVFGRTHHPGDEVPLFAVLRDTLGDSAPENDRLRYVWTFTAASPAWWQRLTAAMPFFYMRPGSRQAGEDPPDPLLDLTENGRRFWTGLFGLTLQHQMFDPRGLAIRASTRAYRGNAGDIRRLHVVRVLAVLSRLEGSEELSEKELRQIMARLALSDRLLGGLVEDRSLDRVSSSIDEAAARNAGRNWEILRQRAESEGLWFDPLALDDEDPHQALLWIRRDGVMDQERARRFNSRFLKIRNPWNDPRLRDWKGYSAVAHFDDQNRPVAPGTPGSKAFDMIPLALYSLDHPKAPLLLVDLRDQGRPRRREMAGRFLNDLARNVLGLTYYGNVYYMTGQGFWNFIRGRRGAPVDPSSRLRAYAHLKLFLNLDDSMDPELRTELSRRLQRVSVNPMENDGRAEMQMANRQYQALLEYASDPNGLARRLEKDRRAELVKSSHKAHARAWLRLANIASLNIYHHREERSPEMARRLDVQRRVAAHQELLAEILESGPQAEITWNVDTVRQSVAFLAAESQKMPDSPMTVHSLRLLGRVFTQTLDNEVRRDCLAALSRVPHHRAQGELLALSEHPAVDANWRALSLEYLRHQERDGEGEGAAGQQ